VLRIVTQHREGMSRRAIARALGVSRNTVRKILREHAESREEPNSALPRVPTRAPRAKKTDEIREQATKLLAKYPTITAQRVFEIVKEEGYDGGYTGVKRLVRELRPKPKPKPSLETPDWGPGKMAESDWSPYTVELVGGGTLKVQAFSYVLAHSTRPHYEAFQDYGVHSLMDGHAAAFERFDGLAETCKYDGQAAVARWEGNQPIYTPRFLAFCAHYEMRPWAIRGNPNLRPNVERSFWSLERSFLVGREFIDLEDFRRQLRQWQDGIVDHWVRRGFTVIDRFREEAPHLLPLPRHPYDTARVLYRVCSIDGFVEYGGNRYAVPYDHVTDILPVRVTERELFVYAATFECVARHELLDRGGHHVVDPAGFHARPKRAAVDLDHLQQAYEGMGVGATEFFGQLSRGPSRTWSAPARRILTLRERYATHDVDAALAHAARYGALGYDAVERILEARHRPRRLDEWVAQETAAKLAGELGERRTERSDLSEYDRLPAFPVQEMSDDPDQDDG